MRTPGMRIAAFALLALPFFGCSRASAEEVSGCICGVDNDKSRLQLVPWNQSKKTWETGATAWFSYDDKTKISGKSGSTMGDVKAGKAENATGIRSLKELVGERAIVKHRGNQISEIGLYELLAGETLPAYGVLGEGGKIESVRPAGGRRCPCK